MKQSPEFLKKKYQSATAQTPTVTDEEEKV